MSTGITKPKRHELQNDLSAIAEIPERVESISVIRLKEILIYIDNEIHNRISFADEMVRANYGKFEYPKKYLPNKQLEYWLKKIFQFGLNYNDLKYLQSHISNYLNRKTEKPLPKDQEQPEIVNQVFKPGGFEVFNFLDDNFRTFNNKPPTKYTILFHFLEGKSVYPNKTKFIEFIRSFCSEKLKEKKFSKIESDYKTSNNFIDSQLELTQLYKDYLETSKS